MSIIFCSFVINLTGMKLVVSIGLIFVSIITAIGQEKQVVVPYTLADRDRAIRSEAILGSYEARFNDIDKRFEAIDKRFDAIDKKFEAVDNKFDRMEDKFTQLFMWGFGIVLMAIFGLVGFIIYDRRTTLAPVEGKTNKLIEALKEAAKEDQTLRKALDKVALW